MKVAYLGLPGSYTFLAAKNYFRTLNSKFVSFKSFADIFKDVSRGSIDMGIVPLENSLTGSIYQIYDLLLTSDLKIIGEVMLKIDHCLLLKNELSLKNIKICYSHIEAIKQCQKFFDKYRNISPVYVEDSASAAKKVAKSKNKYISAIANKYTAELYNLKVVFENIQDNRNNYTRFIIIGNGGKSNGDKVSLIFSVEHQPGSLLRALMPYARMGLNLTKIESRPLFGKPWEYIFFVDFMLNKKENSLTLLLSQMKEHVKFVKVLGKYPQGKIYES